MLFGIYHVTKKRDRNSEKYPSFIPHLTGSLPPPQGVRGLLDFTNNDLANLYTYNVYKKYL